MAIRTKVINKTTKKFIIKEGTAGIYRRLKELAEGESYSISVDPNATYREYWCATEDNDPNAVILSSDDCQEYSEVRIIVTDVTSPEPKYGWVGDKRVKDKEAPEKAGEPLNENVVTPNENVVTPNENVVTPNGNVIVRFWNRLLFNQGNAQP